MDQCIYGCRQSIHLQKPYKESLAITYKQRCLLMGISSDLQIYIPLPTGLPSLCQPGQGDAESRGQASAAAGNHCSGQTWLLRSPPWQVQPGRAGGGLLALGMDEIYTSLSVMNFAWAAGDGDGEME